MESHVRKKIETAMIWRAPCSQDNWYNMARHKKAEENKKKIIDLLMEGFEPGVIAETMGINKRTMKNYFSSLARDYGIPAQHSSPYITYMRIFYLEAIRRGLYTPTVRESVSLGE